MKREILYQYTPNKKTPITTMIDDNILSVKNLLKDCDDVVYRQFKIGGDKGRDVFLFYIDGMADKELLNNFVLKPLMLMARMVEPTFEDIKDELYEASKVAAMSVTDFKENDNIEEAVLAVLSGDTAIFMDGENKALIIATKFFPVRGVQEPTAETVIRGSRDGFTETIRMNTALVRRRIRDPRFKIKQKQIGVRSKTDIAVMYIDDIVDKQIVDEVINKLNGINIDAILDSGYIQQYLEDRPFSLFPQVQTTERPDVVAAAVYEGRVAILVDNSPFALIVPVTLTAFFQSPEDYYSRTVVVSFVRILRIICGGIAILAPALYIAITSFSPGIIPTKLALSIAATREGVPFPAFIEAIIMELTLELLREAGVRLPRPIGSTIGIVGGLVIGQAAVSAGIVSPIMVIVVAITAISSFSIPNYELSAAFRLVRFLLMVFAAVFGLYGIVLGSIIVLIHLSNLKSFGVPFLAPIAPFEYTDIKDSVIFRAPWRYMIKRPRHINPKDEIRQAGDENAEGQ
ncbi:MAG: spore germination protein [Caloramator sp.]|jgi:spore germination protein|uniref:spore germination protein n=1 Tax=Caloramator sp. TaxID=1871330 RepID=UPI001D69D6CC|nr:spore germination protein [Caloramator sp.]MBZ4663972.1 spore germination protein [Caloramator sp.]